jgi:hypothetical protein
LVYCGPYRRKGKVHLLKCERSLVCQYLNVLLDRPAEHVIDRQAIVAAFQKIVEMEQTLTERVHSYLEGAPGRCD